MRNQRNHIEPLILALFVTIVIASPLLEFTTTSPSSFHLLSRTGSRGKSETEALRLRGGSATALEVCQVDGNEPAVRYAEVKSTQSMLVVGAGALGGHLIEQYKTFKNESHIVAMTRSKMRHEKLLKAGAEPVAIEDFFPEELKDDFTSIVFLVPPAQFGYLETLSSALKKWNAKKHTHSKFIFASSVSVFCPSDEDIDEKSPTDPDASPNAKVLLEAEKLVLAEGGTVLRFAGLYSLEPGVGSFFLRGGNLQVRPDKIVGVVSYHDAAAAIIKVLFAEPESPDKFQGQIFVIADGQDQSMESIFRSALKAGEFTYAETCGRG